MVSFPMIYHSIFEGKAPLETHKSNMQHANDDILVDLAWIIIIKTQDHHFTWKKMNGSLSSYMLFKVEQKHKNQNRVQRKSLSVIVVHQNKIRKLSFHDMQGWHWHRHWHSNHLSNRNVHVTIAEYKVRHTNWYIFVVKWHATCEWRTYRL